MQSRGSNDITVNSIGEYHTLAQAASIKRCDLPALRQWLSRNPAAPRIRVGSTIMVRLADLSEYEPRY